MARAYPLFVAAGLLGAWCAVGCQGPEVGDAVNSGGSGGSPSVSAGSSNGGQGSGGTIAPYSSDGGTQSGGFNAGGGQGGTGVGDGGEAGAGGSGACEGDGTSTRGPELVCIPGGAFNMGTDLLAFEGLIATPVHLETVPSFYMDRTEVTLGQYKECMQDAPTLCTPPDDFNVDFDIWCYFPDEDQSHSDYPVNCIDWGQAKAFCEWAGKRLPTEVEWEYAVRSPKNRVYPWGNGAPMNQLCWGPTSNNPCPVGAHPEGDTAEGLSDLAGNVWEMTSSYYCPYTEQGIGTPCDESTVIRRGGSFTSNATYHANGGYREKLVPSFRDSNIGFRCAR